MSSTLRAVANALRTAVVLNVPQIVVRGVVHDCGEINVLHGTPGPQPTVRPEGL
jgi:hypothetical protein